ncbi:MAG: acyl-CoA/acyl-ACP dehydrogenase, partial [Pseudonocardia sp.]|nr:acyl-CoA/acyl-ACP dehydrogenase [Pseudonocardia sp.]
MDFDFDTEQDDLRSAVRSLLERAYGENEQRRKVVAADPGFDEKLWSRLAEMGLLGLPFAEAHGGAGAGPVEVAIVAEEIGRVLAPEPLVEVVVLAGGLIDAAGTDAQRSRLLSGIADGSLIVAFAHAEPGTRWAASASGVRAVRAGDGWRLSGTKEPVVNGARADVLVVSAATDDGTRLFVVAGDADGLARTGYRTHDGGRAAHLAFADTPAEALGDAADDTARIAHVLAQARIAYAHEAVGVMSAAITATSDYLKTRKQFGVPLSTFQALTFRAADMYVSLELARSAALWATLVIDSGGDVLAAADHARLQTGKAGRHIGQESVQLHGGIGVTAEYSAGHRLSRLTAIDHLLGDRDWALARLA